MSDVCTIPPMGWVCTRIGGHDGPCAAEPAVELSDRDSLMIELAYCRHVGMTVSQTADRVLTCLKVRGIGPASYVEEG